MSAPRLLSRLLDEVPGVLGLREPHPLQTLADMADEASGGEAYLARLKTFLRLWSRGFEATSTVVLKATSIDRPHRARSFWRRCPT